jgi:hypothetical protein
MLKSVFKKLVLIGCMYEIVLKLMFCNQMSVVMASCLLFRPDQKISKLIINLQLDLNTHITDFLIQFEHKATCCYHRCFDVERCC